MQGSSITLAYVLLYQKTRQMIELRWLLDPEHPEEYKDNAPLDAYTLQYRIMITITKGDRMLWDWTEWTDVPFISENR